MKRADCMCVRHLAAAAVLVVCYALWRWRAREGFASKRAREVADAAGPLFAKHGATLSYSAFKAGVPGADPVLHVDLRREWKARGRLDPERLERSV